MTNMISVQVRASALAPLAFIILWSGAVVDIPTGWKLCDGTSGTPDLSDRFILNYTPDSIGFADGSNTVIPSTHRHQITTEFSDTETGHIHAGEPHDSSASPDNQGNSIDAADGLGSHVHPVTHTISPIAHAHQFAPSGAYTDYASLPVDPMPPYYSIAYIQGPDAPAVGQIVWFGGSARALMPFSTPGWATLAADLLIGDTTLLTTGTPATTVSAHNQDRYYIDGEIIRLYDVGGAPTSWEVKRGVDGSSEVNHTSGTGIRQPNYVMCMGQAGTPFARGDFILGAGGSFSVNEVVWPDVDIVLPNHVHTGSGLSLSAAIHEHGGGSIVRDTFSDDYAVADGPYASYFPVGGTLTATPHSHEFGTGTAFGGDGSHSHGASGFHFNNSGISAVGGGTPAFYILVLIKRIA